MNRRALRRNGLVLVGFIAASEFAQQAVAQRDTTHHAMPGWRQRKWYAPPYSSWSDAASSTSALARMVAEVTGTEPNRRRTDRGSCAPVFLPCYLSIADSSGARSTTARIATIATTSSNARNPAGGRAAAAADRMATATMLTPPSIRAGEL
jgi:hypothetical protein